MSGTENPAFEDSRLSILEAGDRIDESMKGNENTSDNEPVGFLAAGYSALGNFLSRHRKARKFLCLTVLNAVIIIYFIFATIYWTNNNWEKGFDWCHGYGMLILLLVFGYGGVLYHSIVKRCIGKAFGYFTRPFRDRIRNLQRTKRCSVISQTLIYTCLLAAIIVFLIFDTADSRERLLSAVGIVILLSFGWIFSKHPGRYWVAAEIPSGFLNIKYQRDFKFQAAHWSGTLSYLSTHVSPKWISRYRNMYCERSRYFRAEESIKWRPVLSGLILQFVFGLLTIRWPVGRAIFQCISEKVATFLDFAKSGAAFIFSKDLVNDGVFAFAVLPVIFYFSFAIEILYYLGVMQWIILNLGRLLQKLIGTTICESVTCAANIFIGMTESPLLIKPYLNKLTASELHTVMCSGFASVSGTVLAAYIGFGANPANLITATLMAAPAALCYSKLFFPETEQTVVTSDNIKLEESKESSLMDAASKGALAGIPLVLGIIANIVAFVSFIALLNALLSWLGLLVGENAWSLEGILSKVFMPLSWIMGVPWEECEDVGTLIGLKTVVNEFVAYQKLGEMKKQKRIFGRTEAIATFAICGFANPGSIGITLGVLSSLAPERKKEISGSVMRAFVGGSAVCFLTASIAGLLMTDDSMDNLTDTLTAVNATIAAAIDS